jgi:hypothetical protein
MTLGCALLIPAIVNAERTVIDNERGGFFLAPYSDEWERIGATVGRKQYEYVRMPSDAVRGLHGRLQHFGSVDEPPDGYAYFPWANFRAYCDDEVRQGHTDLQCYATYQGKARPLYFGYSGCDPNWPFMAVNVADDRFVKFWIKNYARGQMMDKSKGWNWVGLDNCSFEYQLYGVLDDNNNCVQGITWDHPYPQNDAEWVNANVRMLQRIKDWAPDIRIACNSVDVKNASDLPRFMQNIDAVMREGFWYYAGGTDGWYRGELYNFFKRVLYTDTLHKVEIFQIPMTATDSDLLRRSYMTYLILGGENFFFGPIDNASTEINPDL